MNLFLFFFTIAVSFIVVRIGGIAFELTGMEKSQARFQSLSCFSGTGFTTREAELITSHPRRRKIATYLMILGNAGLVTLIATLANSIRPINVMEKLNFFSIPLPIPAFLSPYINIFVIIIGVYLFYQLFLKSRLAERIYSKVRKRIVEKKIIIPEKIVEQLLAPEGFGLSQFELPQGHPMIGKALQEINLKEIGIQVLMAQRGESVISIPKGDFRIAPEDRLICFGKLEKIREIANI